jgi:hypothetical protein
MWHVTRYTGTVISEKSGTSIFTLNMEIVRSSGSWLVHQATRHHVSEHRHLSSSSRREKFKCQVYSFYKTLQDTFVYICIRVVPVWILSGLPATVVEGFRAFIRSVSAGKGGRSVPIIQRRLSSSVLLYEGPLYVTGMLFVSSNCSTLSTRGPHLAFKLSGWLITCRIWQSPLPYFCARWVYLFYVTPRLWMDE